MAYYNPSKLSFLEESNVLISIKTYQWKQFSYENYFGEGKRLNDSEFSGIPSMMAGEFKIGLLPNHKFACSQTSTDIEKSPDSLPEDIGQTVKGGLGSIEYQRMRFIIGVDLPLFNKKLKN